MPKAKSVPKTGWSFLDMYILVVLNEKIKFETPWIYLGDLKWNYPMGKGSKSGFSVSCTTNKMYFSHLQKIKRCKVSGFWKWLELGGEDLITKQRHREIDELFMLFHQNLWNIFTTKQVYLRSWNIDWKHCVISSKGLAVSSGGWKKGSFWKEVKLEQEGSHINGANISIHLLFQSSLFWADSF